MKILLSLITMTVISLSLCGCMSARVEQNPQPRTLIPCKEWESMAKRTDNLIPNNKGNNSSEVKPVALKVPINIERRSRQKR